MKTIFLHVIALIYILNFSTLKISAQICPNFSIENKYNYSTVSFLFNNQSPHEIFSKSNTGYSGNKMKDLRYTIKFDFDNNKVYWTSSDFQGVITKIHDIVSTEHNTNLIIVNCTTFSKNHDQIINGVIELDTKNKTCLYYYSQSKEYSDPELKEAGTHAVVTAAEYFEFK